MNGSPAIKASILRINPAGAFAKIALATDDGRDIQVELPQDRYDELALRAGETVYVSARKARVFTPEYQI